MKNWNDDWRDELEKDYEDVYIRLCECRNTRKDMRLIAKLMQKYNMAKSKEDIIDRTVEWITDWNNQVSLVPDDTEYDILMTYLEK